MLKETTYTVICTCKSSKSVETKITLNNINVSEIEDVMKITIYADRFMLNNFDNDSDFLNYMLNKIHILNIEINEILFLEFIKE